MDASTLRLDESATSAPLHRGPRLVPIGERILELRLSSGAVRALSEQRGPLDIEMELYFSCLIRKRVHFRDVGRADVAARANLTDSVSVSFRPVMTKACSIRDVADAPDVQTVSLVRTTPFTPKWLALDYARGRWSGSFGF